MRPRSFAAGLGWALFVWPALLPAIEHAPPASGDAETTPPRPLAPIAAAFPSSVSREETALAVVRVEIDARGEVLAGRVIESGGAPFDRAALEAIARARFEPATYGGQPVRSIMDVRFEFAGDDSRKAQRPVPAMTAVVRASRPKTGSEVTIDGEILRAAPRMNATDVLRVVPGLVASQHGGEGKAHQILLRGFDALHGQDVEISVDGLPVNEVSHIHALGYANMNFLIPEAVREVTVQEGPYRSSQGDFAVAGSVHFGLGLEEKGVLIAPGFGSFGQRRLVVGIRPGDDASTFAAAELSGGDGFGPARHHSKASALAQGVTELGNGARLRTLLGSYAARNDDPGVLRDDDLAAGRVGFFDTYSSRQGGSSSRHQGLVELELAGAAGERTALTAYGIRTSLRLRQNFTGFRFDPRGDGQEQTHAATTIGLRADHKRSMHILGHTWRLEGGVGARHDVIEQSQRRYREVDGSFYARDIEATVAQTNLWSHAEVATRVGGWRLRFGGRADAIAADVVDAPLLEQGGYSRSAHGVHMGLKGMVARDLGANTRMALEYGDGFRSPQAGSLSEGERTPIVRVRAGEVNVRHDGRKIDLSASLFGSHVADDFYFDHAVGMTVPVGETIRTGVSLSARARPLEGLHASLSATAAHAAMMESRTLLPYFAPLAARADGGYRRAFRALGQDLEGFAGSGLTLIGPRPLPFGEFSRTVFLADVRLAIRRGGVALRLDVTNLFDARWRDGEFAYASVFDRGRDSSLLPARHFTAGPPRTVWASLEMHL